MPVTKEEVVSKVRKLFELSRSPNENEAALALARAREMLSKHHLSMADLTVEEMQGSLDVTSASVEAGKVLRVWVKALLYHVAKGFDCENLIQRRFNAAPLVTFIGTAEDVQIALAAFQFLFRELTGLADRALPVLKREARGWSATSLRYAYLEGAVTRIGERFREETRAVRTVEGEKCRDLVVVKDDLIQRYLHKTFPGMTRMHHKPRTVSAHAYEKGYHDGGAVPLGRGDGTGPEAVRVPIGRRN
ncbi:MAG: DUF2786 domain-containing protein [Thermodesulfobacteriota bacterium]